MDEHAPGIPKVLVGNRLHLAFKRQVAARQAEMYASRHKMACFEISPLCDFNIRESFCELARMALHRNGMERIWRTNKGWYRLIYLCVGLNHSLINLNCLKILFQYFRFKSCAVEQSCDEFEAFIQSIVFIYHPQ